MATTEYSNCTDCCEGGGCSSCADFDGNPNLTISDGSASQEMVHDGDSWPTSVPNTLMGALPGFPEEDVVWDFACDGETATLNGVPANSFACGPLEAVFGPYDGYDGGGPYYLTVTLSL